MRRTDLIEMFKAIGALVWLACLIHFVVTHLR